MCAIMKSDDSGNSGSIRTLCAEEEWRNAERSRHCGEHGRGKGTDPDSGLRSVRRELQSLMFAIDNGKLLGG